MFRERETTKREDEENNKRQNVQPTRDVEFLSSPHRPLREVLGLHSPTTEPLRYRLDPNHSRPGMKAKKPRKRERERGKKAKAKEAPCVESVEFPKDVRATAAEHRMADNLENRMKDSTSSTIFSSSELAIPPTAPVAAVPTIPHTGSVCSPPPGITSAASTQDTASHVQSNEISSCSEVEVVLNSSQQRRRTRKRRRFTSKLSLSQNSATSKLSLSQNSTRHHHQSSQSSQPSHTQDDEQQLSHTQDDEQRCQVYFSSDSSIDITADGLDPRQCTGRPDTQPGPASKPASFPQVGVAGPAQCFRQAVHRPAHTSSTTGERSKVKATTSTACQRTNNAGSCNNATLSFSLPPAAHHSHRHRPLQGHTQTQQSCVRREEVASEDSDETVYFEAHTHLSFLEESQPGPSGVQRPAGEVVQTAARQTGDADTSSSSMKESDNTLLSSSSSDSCTIMFETKLSKAVLKQQQTRNSQMQTQHKVCQEGASQPYQRQTRGHSQQAASHPDTDTRQDGHHPRTSSRKPPNARRPPHPQQAEDGGVSSSTPDDLIEQEPRRRQVQGPRESSVKVTSSPSSRSDSSSTFLTEKDWLCKMQKAQELSVTAASTLNSSVTSSSCGSSSDSSALLSKAGKGCIQTIGEVFQRYFGGTVEDKLMLLQKKNFNLLHCLLELQKPSSSPPPNQPSAPSQ